MGVPGLEGAARLSLPLMASLGDLGDLRGRNVKAPRAWRRGESLRRFRTTVAAGGRGRAIASFLAPQPPGIATSPPRLATSPLALAPFPVDRSSSPEETSQGRVDSLRSPHTSRRSLLPEASGRRNRCESRRSCDAPSFPEPATGGNGARSRVLKAISGGNVAISVCALFRKSRANTIAVLVFDGSGAVGTRSSSISPIPRASWRSGGLPRSATTKTSTSASSSTTSSPIPIAGRGSGGYRWSDDG